jgi:hypothetical protein
LQKQLPPQSSVPNRQSVVHTESPQLGAADCATHELGWQQPAGTQSESVAHASLLAAGSVGAGVGSLGVAGAGS